MGYEPRDTTGGGSSESRESTEGNRETREREERGRDRDNRNNEPTSSAAPEQQEQQEQQEKQTSQSNQVRRSVDPTEVEDSRSFLGRIRGLFEDDDEPDQMTDQQGNVVAESFTIDRPAEIQTVNLGEKTDYETIDSPNPYESYARSVVDDGLVGGEQTEKDLAKEIASAGRLAQAADVASTFGSVVAGPVGAVPGLVHDVVTTVQDDQIQQAGESLYESGKVNVPGASTVIGSVFGGVAGSAYDVANEVFGGGSTLGEFEKAAGVEYDPRSPTGSGLGGDGGGQQLASTPVTTPTQQPSTMAETFSMSTVQGNVYSDFLDNFFKQG